MTYTFWTEGFWTFNLGHNTGWVVLHLGGLLIKVIISKIFSFLPLHRGGDTIRQIFSKRGWNHQGVNHKQIRKDDLLAKTDYPRHGKGITFESQEGMDDEVAYFEDLDVPGSW